MKPNYIEKPFFRFYFEDPSPLWSIDIYGRNYDIAKAFLDDILSSNVFLCNLKVKRYQYFQNIY